MNELAQQTHQQLGIQLTTSQKEALAQYENELLTWNKRYNLTAINNPREVQVKHFLDSLTCTLALRDSPMERVIDIGTGAGFPGLPLKIIYPSIQLTLVDSVGKKAEFCRHVVNVLNLDDVQIIQQRAENIGHDPAHREQYDWALARAVAIMPVLVEYLLPLVRVGGGVLAMKGESGPAETHTADHALSILGGHLRQLTQVTLPGVVEERYLIVVDKVAATPDKYPRRVGIPAKRPLSN
jgi:16S rRNA (guanine527-N7)-methyltransferase